MAIDGQNGERTSEARPYPDRKRQIRQMQPRNCLAESQPCPARFETILESIQDGLIALDSEWRLVCVNEAAAVSLRSSRDELIGRVLWEAVPHWRHSRLQEELLHAVEQRTFVGFEDYSLLSHWYEYRCYPTEEGVTLLFHDITERKRMEEELRQLNEHLDQQVAQRTAELTQTVDRLYHEVSRRILVEGYLRKRSQMVEAFFQHTITPMAFMNWCFDFVRVNEAYANAAGKDPEYFVGRNFFSLHPDTRMQAIFERVVRTREPYRAYATPLHHADDPQQAAAYWNWQLTPLLNERGEVQFVVLNLQDVTEQQMALQESQEHARRLQQLTLELSQAEDRERARLAEVLHDDLQQTLAAAKFHLGLLGRRVANNAELQELAVVTNVLLKQAIDTSRSLSHELSPPALFDDNLCETFKWLAQQMQSKHGLTVHLDVCESFIADLGELGQVEAPGKRIVLQSEPLKAFLYKAAQEMLFNVIKHADIREARLRVRHRCGRIYLSVADKGRGFDPGRLVKSDGFGLLSICERVKLLGGRIKIKSADGKGSIFLLAVPDSEPPTPQQALRPA